MEKWASVAVLSRTLLGAACLLVAACGRDAARPPDKITNALGCKAECTAITTRIDAAYRTIPTPETYETLANDLSKIKTTNDECRAWTEGYSSNARRGARWLRDSSTVSDPLVSVVVPYMKAKGALQHIKELCTKQSPGCSDVGRALSGLSKWDMADTAIDSSTDTARLAKDLRAVRPANPALRQEVDELVGHLDEINVGTADFASKARQHRTERDTLDAQRRELDQRLQRWCGTLPWEAEGDATATAGKMPDSSK